MNQLQSVNVNPKGPKYWLECVITVGHLYCTYTDHGAAYTLDVFDVDAFGDPE